MCCKIIIIMIINVYFILVNVFLKNEKINNISKKYIDTTLHDVPIIHLYIHHIYLIHKVE